MTKNNRDDKFIDEIIDVWTKSVNNCKEFKDISNENYESMKSLTRLKIKDIENLFVVKNDNEKIIGVMGVENKSLEMIFVDPSYTKQGIAKNLIDIAVNNHYVQNVTLHKDNISGIDFCKHMGFTNIVEASKENHITLKKNA